MTREDFIKHYISHGVWHMTHPERFLGILKASAIQVNPDLPSSERWKSSDPSTYPYVRSIGGVSLFNFEDFDAVSYEARCPMSDWDKFVPYRQKWGGAVWIEIGTETTPDHFLSAEDLKQGWDQDGKGRHTRMPEIEFAHVGDLPAGLFKSAFLVSDNGDLIRHLPLHQHDEIIQIVETWRLEQESL